MPASGVTVTGGPDGGGNNFGDTLAAATAALGGLSTLTATNVTGTGFKLSTGSVDIAFTGTGFAAPDGNGVPQQGTITDVLVTETGTAVLDTHWANLSVTSATFWGYSVAAHGGDQSAVVSLLTGMFAGNDHFVSNSAGGTGSDTFLGFGGDDLFDAQNIGQGYYLSGGDGNDTFNFGAAFDQFGEVDGGANTDTVYLDGGGTNAYFAPLTLPGGWPALPPGVTPVGLLFTPTTLTNVENVVLAAGSSYGLTLNDATVANGATLSVIGSAVGPSNHVYVDGVNVMHGALDLSGGGGPDFLRGGSGNDTLDGGPGNDGLFGGMGLDTATYADAPSGVTVSLLLNTQQNTGGAGTDFLYSIENLTGSAFADTLTGLATGSTLTGGAGNDLLIGGVGNDTFNGGAGVDTVSYAGAGAAVHVSLLNSAAQNTVGAGTDTLTSIEKLVGSLYADTLTAGTAGSTLNGGNGGDDLLSGPGSDILNGGGASDFADYALATAGVTVNLTTAGFQNTVGAGSDELVSIEKVVGSGFSDTITGDAGVNTLFGEGGNDAVNGGANGDYLFGNAGADTLNGGAGQDSLTGGAGNDTFVFSALSDTLTAHPDTILDFAPGDLIDLRPIDANTTVAGDQAFVIGAAGQAGHIVVHAFDAGNNRTEVDLYVDNNPSIDAAIWLTGDHHTLAAGDFKL